METEIQKEYERRRQLSEQTRAEAEASFNSLATARLWVFLLAVVLGVFVIRGHLHPAWLLLPLVVFAILVSRHSRVERRAQRATRRVAFYARGLARLDGSWVKDAGGASDGHRFSSPEHPYAEHLDVLGRGSLFALLTLARTPHGERELADWLLRPAMRSEVLRRQVALEELRDGLPFREEIALLGEGTVAATHLEGLEAWGERPAQLPTRAGRWILHALPLPALGLLVAAVGFGTPLWIAGVVFVVAAFSATRFSGKSDAARRGVDGAARDLGILRGLIERLEAERFQAPLLQEVQGALASEGRAASARVRELERLVGAHDWIRNQLFAPIALVTFWPIQTALLIERWRLHHGRHLRDWLHAVGTFEAVSSLAGHAFENPANVFPDIVDEGPKLWAEGLAHPLLPRESAVPNDVRLDSDHRALLVSGSNMSGKSTFLRTVGVAAILAQAGATVPARRLTMSPLTVAASIHVHDSLLDGESRFYAEVTRIGQIVEMSRASGPCVLFLLDELFHGTHSHDRRVGGAAVVRTLLTNGAVGLVTTHDLELARLVDDMAGSLRNVHFTDEYRDGRMSFDYRLREGVVERSNALALMRAVGLDV